MKLFIDTANINYIKEASTWGFVDGVTTNPSLIAKEGRSLVDAIHDIVKLVNGPISAEVKEDTVDKMYAEAIYYAGIDPNIVIKVPMTLDGLMLVKKLSSEEIKTNVTLVFTVAQALVAAKNGATYVSPFMGRLDDLHEDPHAGETLIREIASMFKYYGYNTQIIAASIRHPEHVRQAALAGAHVATVPYQVLLDMLKHPLTQSGLAKFAADSAKKV